MTDSVASRAPLGFRVHTANIGIKDSTTDLALVVSDVPCAAAGVYTCSRFAGPSVALSRGVTGSGTARGLVVISKNANVANGPRGDADAAELADLAAAALGVADGSLVVASTGVIGRAYPMDRIRDFFGSLDLAAAIPGTFEDAAAAIMTTDTHPKFASATIPTTTGGTSTIVGIAKGVGMIEPDMATLLTFFFTDAALGGPDGAPATLDAVFRRVVDRTFNAVSIDTDTSTSDSAAVLANGLAGPVDVDVFEAALGEVALALTRMIAADGEGAEHLIEVEVTGARDDAQAKGIAKSIVNSPLVKTAVAGADPNWGRIVMAIGKYGDAADVEQDAVRVWIGDELVYPSDGLDATLAAAAEAMRRPEVAIRADLGIADGAFTVYGCDLTDGYIRINADYTT